MLKGNSLLNNEWKYGNENMLVISFCSFSSMKNY